jgi:hypothetical protein
MPELLDIQQDLAGSMHDAGAAPLAKRWLRGDAVLLEGRLAIYRANVAASATKALGAAYPVVRLVVGEGFFDGLARAYQRLFPSTSGDLFDYGAAFAEFVTEFPHTQSLPYLADLARLEWAVHRAYGAEDAPPLDQQALAQVAPARQEAIRLKWAAGTAIVDSNFPIAHLWRIHQSDFEGEFRVDWSVQECALVAREGFRVVVSTLCAANAAFIASSLAGASLGASVEVALAADSGFDFGHLLGRLMATNVICGFRTDEDD